MPLDRNWRHIRRVARLTPLQERCLRMLCAGWEMADEIASNLDIEDAGVVVKALLDGQGKCRASRPWLREPYAWEVARAKRAHERQRVFLVAAGKECPDYSPVEVIDRDKDLLDDAREIIEAVRNSGMAQHGAHDGGIPPDAHSANEYVLRDYWIRCLTGGRDSRPRRPVADYVIEEVRRHAHAKP
jgi:hypothetical protein